METILSYLENMFLHLPQTEEVLRAKQELGNMMEDKYNELIKEGKRENEAVGIVISEFGNLDELAEELGLDPFMKPEAETEVRRVGRKEADAYIKESSRTSKWISLGVMLCIYSPIPVLFMGGMQEKNGNIPDSAIILFGVIPLLLMVGVAVAIFIYNGTKMERFEYLKKENFQIDSVLEQYLQEMKESERMASTLKVIIGVLLCIFSAMPVLIAACFTEDDQVMCNSVIVLLGMIGIAIWFFLAGGSKMESIKVLCQEGDFTREAKKKNKFMDVVGGIYWPVVTAIYLLWSFSTMNWASTWIIWPVAGALFGGIAAICGVVQASRNSHKQ